MAYKFSIVFDLPQDVMLKSTGDTYTLIPSDAMVFASQDEAIRYIEAHKEALKVVGKNPQPGRIKM